MVGYIRQSINEIEPEEDINAEPLSNEFNALAAAFRGATGHSHNGTSGNGPKINLSTSVVGILPSSHIENNSIPINKLETITASKVLGNMTNAENVVTEVDVLNDPTLVSNSSTSIPTQFAVKGYVDVLEDAVVEALDSVVEFVNDEVTELTDYVNTEISDLTDYINEEIENISTSTLIYDVGPTTLNSGSNITISGIDGTKIRELQIEGHASLTSNVDVTSLALSVSDGTTWFDIPTSSCLVRWSNGGTTNRYFFATVHNLDDTALAIYMNSQTRNEVDPFVYFLEPVTYGSRPITAIRIRSVATSGSNTANILKLRVRGIKK